MDEAVSNHDYRITNVFSIGVWGFICFETLPFMLTGATNTWRRGPLFLGVPENHSGGDEHGIWGAASNDVGGAKPPLNRIVAWRIYSLNSLRLVKVSEKRNSGELKFTDND